MEVHSMTNLPEKVINNISAVKTVVFATVSDAGIPNVVPNQFTIVKDPETILVGDNFWHKTADNLTRPNCNVALTSWEGYEGYQLKGIANYVTEGPDYEMMKQKIKSRNEKLPAKGCAILKVTEVYDLAPGPNAGKRIA
jgi:predicted pyridoxine 5'-phosphate oxidase superfamily flavin-nucleotide-binding protein